MVESFADERPPVPWEKVICSWHDFAETPHDLISRYELMAGAPAAVVKIATQANRIGDCLRIFEVIEHAKGKKPVTIKPAPEELETEDILEMVNAGLVKITIADSYIAKFWKQIGRANRKIAAVPTEVNRGSVVAG